ncbi:MAG TPA: hypothetical protein VFV78_12975, partial [Vicinamibacterales bacterium]|nr:hypothetical protein [Vicinamibacterales bacterium]
SAAFHATTQAVERVAGDAAAALILIEELRVELPGEATVPAAGVLDRDSKAAEEDERRAAGIPAVEAAAIAVEIAVDHQKAEQAEEDSLR